jgi:ribose-phosphate pyrophosphokinase
LGFCYKTREKGNNSIVSFVGDVDKKNVFIIDDMIDTATSLCNIIYKAKDKGANKIYACATHAILSGEAISKLVSSPVEKIFITNSICHSELPSKFQVANLSELLGKTIRAVNADKSVGELFEKESCV